jgi:putative membrane protein
MSEISVISSTRFKFDKVRFGIFTVYLFHLSAIIGTLLGYLDWFVPKTPINLLLVFILLIWIFPLDTIKKVIASLIFFGGGMLVEFLGTNYSLFFGAYEYGETLGLKIGGVPLLIGINWAILVLMTGEISNNIKIPKWGKAMVGAAFMVILDFFIEPVAPVFDFWIFDGGVAPLSNYMAWFAIALILHGIFQKMKIKGNFKFSLHLYICQILFFAFFYGYFSL